MDQLEQQKAWNNLKSLKENLKCGEQIRAESQTHKKEKYVICLQESHCESNILSYLNQNLLLIISEQQNFPSLTNVCLDKCPSLSVLFLTNNIISHQLKPEPDTIQWTQLCERLVFVKLLFQVTYYQYTRLIFRNLQQLVAVILLVLNTP